MEELEMESFLLVSSCFGAEQPAPENYNGGKLRELLDEHHMAAIDTFFPAGDTYYGQFGNNSRIDMFAFREPCWPGLKAAKFFFLQARDCNLFLPLEKGPHALTMWF